MASVQRIPDLAMAKEMVEALRSGNTRHLLKIGSRITSKSERLAMGKKLCELCDKEDDNPLYHAARHVNAEICQLLIEDFGLNAKCVYPSGKTPLCFAAYFGDSFVIENLITYGADIHAEDNNGFKPIHHAVIGDKHRAIQKLINSGAEIHGHDSESPLLLSTLLGHTSCMNFLLNHQPNLDELLCGVVTPLLLVVMNNESCKFHPLDKTREILESLILAGADVNMIQLLSLAYHSKELMEVLLAHGADPNLPNESERLPIEVAAMRGKREIVELLFLKTTRIPSVQDWSVEGLLTKFASERFASEERLETLKLRIAEMVLHNEYLAALVLCNYAIEENPEDATVYYANRSFCWKHLASAVHERYLTNATTDADLIGMQQVIGMLGNEHLSELVPVHDYIRILMN